MDVIKQLQMKLDQIKPVARSIDMPLKQSEGTQMSPLKPARQQSEVVSQSGQTLEMEAKFGDLKKKYEECCEQKEHQQMFIEQLKVNFELELERLDQQH